MGIRSTPRFFAPGGGGWADEPLSAALQLPDRIFGELFPGPEPALSLTALLDDEPIGHAEANRWSQFLRTVPAALARHGSYQTEGERRFAELIGEAMRAEAALLGFLEARHCGVDQVAHNCGVMVLREYRGRGYARALMRRSLEHLAEQGFRVLVVETSNQGSYAVMRSLGFQVFRSLSYRQRGIPLDDAYTIWFRWLQPPLETADPR